MQHSGYWEIYNGNEHIGDCYNIEEVEKAIAAGYQVYWCDYKQPLTGQSTCYTIHTSRH